MNERVSKFLKGKYGSEIGDAEIIEQLKTLYDGHADLADAHFEEEFCSGDEEKFQQRYFEMSLSAKLRAQGYTVTSAAEGPDFRIEIDSDVMWIEAIAPGPGRSADQVPTDKPRVVVSPGKLPEVVVPKRPEIGVATVTEVPSDKILLRWTHAISTKLGKIEDYIAKGIIHPGEAVVIAVNSSQLGRHGNLGISQYPAAMEAVYPIGPRYVKSDITSEKAPKNGITYRSEIVKLSGAGVPTTIFLQPRGAVISAVLGAHYSERDEPPHRLSVVHNIKAAVQLQNGVFADADDYRLEHVSGDDYRIKVN